MTRLDTHVRSVRRKLTFALFVEALAWAGLILTAAVFVAILVQRLFTVGLPNPGWWLLGGAGAAVLGAAIVALVKRPDASAAAVAIDRELGLKEKFSTALHVRRGADLNDPFAAAAVRDAERTAEGVSLAKRFGPEFPRAGYGLAAAVCAVFLAFWMVPSVNLFGRTPAVAKAAEDQQKKAAAAAAERMVKEVLQQTEIAPRVVADTEEIKMAKQTLKDLLASPITDPAKANRTAADAAKKLEEALKSQVATGQKFAQAREDQKLFRSMPRPGKDEKGAVAEARRDVAEGKFDEAVKNLNAAVENSHRIGKTESNEPS